MPQCRGQFHRHQRAERHHGEGTQRTTAIGGPERGAGVDVGREVARVIGHIGAIPQRPGGRLGHDQVEGGEREAGTHCRCGCHVAGVQQNQHQGAGKNQRGQQAHPRAQAVDQLVADKADDKGQQADHHDRLVIAHGYQRLQGIAHQHAAGGEEQDCGRDHHQQRERGTMDTELGPALDHLWHAQVRPLGRVRGHEHGTDEVADQQAQQGPAKA